MNTTHERLMNTFKTGVCVLAFAAILAAPATAFGAEAAKDVSAKADTQVEKDAQDQTAEKRKEIVAEAVAALNETRAALKALDDKNGKEALSALERATGKLEIILARDPALALAPTGVSAATYDVLATLDAIHDARDKAEDLLEDGRVQEARRLMRGLASETVISTTNIPLATYPAAIKAAARLIHEDKSDEAKTVLQAALNTLVVTENVIPLPVVTAEALLKEAEKLAENKERKKEESERLSGLLTTAETEIKFAEALGYGQKKDFKHFYEEI